MLACPIPNHTSATSRSHPLYCFGKHQESAGSNRKLALSSTQASRASSRGAESRWLFQILLNPLQLLLNMQIKRPGDIYDKHSSGYTFPVAPERFNLFGEIPHARTLH